MIVCDFSIRILTERLNRVNESITKKEQTRDEYDRAMRETEGAYVKVSVADR